MDTNSFNQKMLDQTPNTGSFSSSWDDLLLQNLFLPYQILPEDGFEMNLNFENWYFDTQPSNWLISGLCLVLCFFFRDMEKRRENDSRVWEIFKL